MCAWLNIYVVLKYKPEKLQPHNSSLHYDAVHSTDIFSLSACFPLFIIFIFSLSSRYIYKVYFG